MIWHGLALFWALLVAVAASRPDPYTLVSLLNNNVARINTIITSVALIIYTLVEFSSPAVICSTIILCVTFIALSFSPKQTPYTPFPFILLLWVCMGAITTFDAYGIAYFTVASCFVLLYVFKPSQVLIAWISAFFIIQAAVSAFQKAR